MRTIAQGEGKNHPVTGSSSGQCFLDDGLNNGMQDRGITDSVKANVFLTHTRYFSAEIDAQDAHEHLDFSTRTLKILRREGKQRERLNAQAPTRRHNLINCLHSCTMTSIPW